MASYGVSFSVDTQIQLLTSCTSCFTMLLSTQIFLSWITAAVNFFDIFCPCLRSNRKHLLFHVYRFRDVLSEFFRQYQPFCFLLKSWSCTFRSTKQINKEKYVDYLPFLLLKVHHLYKILSLESWILYFITSQLPYTFNYVIHS